MKAYWAKYQRETSSRKKLISFSQLLLAKCSKLVWMENEENSASILLKVIAISCIIDRCRKPSIVNSLSFLRSTCATETLWSTFKPASWCCIPLLHCWMPLIMYQLDWLHVTRWSYVIEGFCGLIALLVPMLSLEYILGEHFQFRAEWTWLLLLRRWDVPWQSSM